MSKKANEFSARLNEAMDDLGIPPRGRQMLLSRQFGISQPSAKRWLDGDNFPDTGKIVELAAWTNTSVDWLLTGRGLKHPDDLNLTPEVMATLKLLRSMQPNQQVLALKLLQALSTSK